MRNRNSNKKKPSLLQESSGVTFINYIYVNILN